MFSIAFDRENRLLRLTISGFWDDDTTAAFVRDLMAASVKAQRQGPFRVLSDAREFAVQSPEVVQRFRRLAEGGSAERTAILVDSALARLQAQRSMANDRVRIFGAVEDALAWLELPASAA